MLKRTLIVGLVTAALGLSAAPSFANHAAGHEAGTAVAARGGHGGKMGHKGGRHHGHRGHGGKHAKAA